MYGRKPVVNSDEDSDYGSSRYNKSVPQSRNVPSYGNLSARGVASRENLDRDPRENASRDNFTRDSRDSRDTYGRESRDVRENNFTRDTRDRDNGARESRDLRDNRDSRDNLRDSRDRDLRREQSFGRESTSFGRESTSFGRESTSYGRERNIKKDQSDSSDNEPVNSRYGASSRRVTRNSSDSDDSGRRKVSNLKLRETGRPMTSSRKEGMPDIDSYDGANQKLKMMIQWDKSLCEQLDDIYEGKQAKDKKIEQLKDEIHKDTIKEEGLRKKLSELRMNRKMLQSRLDEFK